MRELVSAACCSSAALPALYPAGMLMGAQSCWFNLHVAAKDLEKQRSLSMAAG
jgi:hypothetical protein